ncbi:hypothetical protein ACHAWO_001692 [Cyclotella atomus]|uniref:Uncharacterized protein n=1 Tax=Cyclotella atomus TaxID=382360 RepID=A0ABD3PZP3_9STRA
MTLLNMAPMTGTSRWVKYVALILNESTASPTPDFPISNTGTGTREPVCSLIPHDFATLALSVPVILPTAGYPTPSIITTFLPTANSSTARPALTNICSEVSSISPLRNARVKPL